MKAIALPAAKAEHVHEARRRLKNAKETLAKAGIDPVSPRYLDPKYVQEAVGIAYLAALEALEGLQPRAPASESVEAYRARVNNLNTRRNKAIGYLNTAYENLHIFAYYRKALSIALVKDGLEAVKKLIDLVDELPEPNPLRKAA